MKNAASFRLCKSKQETRSVTFLTRHEQKEDGLHNGRRKMECGAVVCARLVTAVKHTLMFYQISKAQLDGNILAEEIPLNP